MRVSSLLLVWGLEVVCVWGGGEEGDFIQCSLKHLKIS